MGRPARNNQCLGVGVMEYMYQSYLFRIQNMSIYYWLLCFEAQFIYFGKCVYSLFLPRAYYIGDKALERRFVINVLESQVRFFVIN